MGGAKALSLNDIITAIGKKSNGKNNHYFAGCFSFNNAGIVSYNKIHVAGIGYGNDVDFNYYEHHCIFTKEMRCENGKQSDRSIQTLSGKDGTYIQILSNEKNVGG